LKAVSKAGFQEDSSGLHGNQIACFTAVIAFINQNANINNRLMAYK
jgi:hypothetical protein